MSPRAKFRLLSNTELDSGLRILHESYDWLLANSIRQWTAPVPKDIYEQWQVQKCNYGLFVDSKLAVVCSLVKEPLGDWQPEKPEKPVLWLHALATAQLYNGKGLGQIAAQYALEEAENRNEELYVLCVSGFLPEYYMRLGFIKVIRRVIRYGEHGNFNMVLLKSGNSS